MHKSATPGEREPRPTGAWGDTASQIGAMFSGMSSDSYHEPIELLSEETKNTHRAIVSLMEELEAIDWYQQRAEACSDPELSAVLTHNKNEEVEHAMMTLEWLRRRHPVFSENIQTYLNSSGPIAAVETAQGAAGDGGKGRSGGGEVERGGSSAGSASLGIGSLKGNK